MTHNTNSVRAQLASLCQDLIQEVDQKDALHQQHSNDHAYPTDTSETLQPQPQHVVSIETALHRNPYAIFLHEPNVIATNLNTTVEKVQQIRKQAATCIMQHQTIETDGCHYDLNWKHNDGTMVLMKSNMLLDYHQQMNIYKEKLLQQGEESLNNQYFSTGSTHLDQWLKQMQTSIIYDTIISNHSRKRMRSQYESQTTIHNNDNGTNDNRTNGGISMGQITQIVGPSASGKTQLALTISAQAILFHSDLCKVHYIVGGGGNSSLVSLSRRFKSIASALLQQQQQEPPQEKNHERYNHVMHQFEISPTYNAYMLLSRLNDIEANLDAQVQYAKEKLNSDMEEEHVSSETNNEQAHLIVIDSISGCISSLVWGDGDGGAGASLMNEIALSLRRLSRMERFPGCPRVAVLVINGVVTNRSTQGTKSALGEAWRAADCTVILEPLYSTVDIDLKSHPVGTASVKDKIVRAMYGEGNKNDETVEFRISSNGITDL